MRTLLFCYALIWCFLPFSNSFSQGTWTDILWTGDDPIPRTECTFIESGDKFYLVGGRGGNKRVVEFNYTTNVWSYKANMPTNLHHFQAVELDGLIYVVGAFGGSFPNEFPRSDIYIYDPVADSWTTGPEIPASRRRGSGGVAVYNNKIYVIGGLTNGHSNGWVKWTDVFDPKTNSWTQLTDAPRERDHFQAVVVGDKIYATAGRMTGAGATVYDSTIAEVDIYDIATDTWSTLPPSGNIPFPCAGALGVNFNGDLVVMGGEVSGSTDALEKVQILDVSAGTWSVATDMHRARHGSQAIVNNSRIYMAGGSRRQGGSLLQTSDSNFLIEGDFTGSVPSGTANSASDLAAKVGSIVFPNTEAGNSSSSSDKILSNNGNQAIIITSLSITGSGSGEFSLGFSSTLPVVLAPGDSIEIPVDFNPSSTGAHAATLEIEHSGATATVQITLSGIGGTPPAPVELIDFSVTNTNGKALLEWATASELNNDYFAMERSQNGFEFTAIGAVPGHGTSLELNEYRFEDAQPFSGKSFYRLKQVDIDGAYTYSSVKEFQIENDQIDIYPNPIGADRIMFLSSNLSREKNLYLQLIDVTGRSVFETDFSAQEGKNTKQIALPIIPTGVYWVKINGDTGRIIQKMVMLR